jgi:hypothetical protein
MLISPDKQNVRDVVEPVYGMAVFGWHLLNVVSGAKARLETQMKKGCTQIHANGLWDAIA